MIMHGRLGRLAHPKVEKIRAEVEEFSKKQSERSLKGWETRRKDAEPMPDECQEPMPDECQAQAQAKPSSSSSSSSSSANQKHSCASDEARVSDPDQFALVEKASRPEDRRAEWFEEFWQAYKPIRSRARKAAFKTFMRVVRSETVYKRLMDGLRSQTAELLSRSPEHRPHASSWLSGERWADEVAEVPAVAKPPRDSITEMLESTRKENAC